MTAFHDAVIATDPIIFVPFDGPDDDSTHAYDLIGNGLMTPVGGTYQDSAGTEVTFAKEVALNGTSQYWIADSALVAYLASYLGGGVYNFTAAIWWRTTVPNSDATARYLMRFSNSGFHLRRQTGILYASIIDQSLTEQVTGRATEEYQAGGGWQLASLQLENDIDMVVLGQNGFRNGYDPTPPDTPIWPNTTYTFTAGRNGGNNNGYWSGSLGPLMLWGRSLTADELMDIYYAGFEVAPLRSPVAKRVVDQRLRVGAVVVRRP